MSSRAGNIQRGCGGCLVVALLLMLGATLSGWVFGNLPHCGLLGVAALALLGVAMTRVLEAPSDTSKDPVFTVSFFGFAICTVNGFFFLLAR